MQSYQLQPHGKLGVVPLSTWEYELPILEACMRDATNHSHLIGWVKFTQALSTTPNRTSGTPVAVKAHIVCHYFDHVFLPRRKFSPC